jgi:hypothetical protein
LLELPASHRKRATLLGDKLDAIQKLFEQAETELGRCAQQTPIVKRLSTVPGIGQIRASQIVAAVVSPHRFRSRRQFWSYIGLGVVTHESAAYIRDKQGTWQRRRAPMPRGLNHNYNRPLKGVFKGAAETVAAAMPNSPLGKQHQRRLETTKPNLAKLTLARQIAAIVLAVWKNNEDYNPERLPMKP